MIRVWLMMAAVLGLAACDGKDNSAQDQRTAAEAPGVAAYAPAPTEPAQASPEVQRADSWVGRWTGPEGTMMAILKDPLGYTVTITNLDGPRQFRGTPEGAGIAFERDGVREMVHAGNGQDTGMKWLADKQNCLVVKPGEGFCRD